MNKVVIATKDLKKVLQVLGSYKKLLNSYYLIVTKENIIFLGMDRYSLKDEKYQENFQFSIPVLENTFPEDLFIQSDLNTLNILANLGVEKVELTVKDGSLTYLENVFRININSELGWVIERDNFEFLLPVKKEKKVIEITDKKDLDFIFEHFYIYKDVLKTATNLENILFEDRYVIGSNGHRMSKFILSNKPVEPFYLALRLDYFLFLREFYKKFKPTHLIIYKNEIEGKEYFSVCSGNFVANVFSNTFPDWRAIEEEMEWSFTVDIEEVLNILNTMKVINKSRRGDNYYPVGIWYKEQEGGIIKSADLEVRLNYLVIDNFERTILNYNYLKDLLEFGKYFNLKKLTIKGNKRSLHYVEYNHQFSMYLMGMKYGDDFWN